jgi:hypothetical protein
LFIVPQEGDNEKDLEVCSYEQATIDKNGLKSGKFHGLSGVPTSIQFWAIFSIKLAFFAV